MGKTSSYPYASGSVSVNGQNVANTYKKGNTVYSNYNMSDAEKGIYDFAQNSFLQNLPNVNVFSPETQASMQNQLNAYTQKGLDTINSLYTPMIDNLKTDIASRFGNFDNSVFLDKLNTIESKRADSMSDLAQDILAQQSNLINDELSRRYTYLNFLGDIQNQINSNIMNYIGLAQKNSASGTSYNAANSKSSGTSSLGSYANLASGALSAAGPYGPAAALALQVGSSFL